jgi:hypothetical protein
MNRHNRLRYCVPLRPTLFFAALLVGCDRKPGPELSPPRDERISLPTSVPMASGDSSRSEPTSARRTALAAPPSTGGATGITFDDLAFNNPPSVAFSATLLSEKTKLLFGNAVVVRGWMHPASSIDTEVTRFFLTRSDQVSGAFLPGMGLDEVIDVRLSPGRTISYSPRPIAVSGTLTLKEVKFLNDQTVCVYQLADADIW